MATSGYNTAREQAVCVGFVKVQLPLSSQLLLHPLHSSAKNFLIPANMVEHNSTPSDTSPTRKRARISDSSDTSSHLPHPDSIRISKRVRTNSSKASEKENQIQLPLPDVTFERRRVNPESLALRLGPELVHDLDALVPPGSRDMPSFASRKELQERHKVDRRHIYDYYHSKGLRVVKEDKHGNPIKQTEPIPVIPQVRRRQPYSL